MPRRVNIRAKMHTLRAAALVCKGGLLAHNTSTLAGIAGLPNHKKTMRKAQHFKQRKGPFLLLADSRRTALAEAIWLPKALRDISAASWPGTTTLVFAAKQRLSPACYQKRSIAVRVDANAEVRRLAKLCGGLLFSSSLNRQGQEVADISHTLRFRWQHHVHGVLTDEQPSGEASRLLRPTAKGFVRLR